MDQKEDFYGMDRHRTRDFENEVIEYDKNYVEYK